MIKTTVDDLIEQVLAYDNTPEIQDTFDPTTISKFLDQEMRSAVVPLIKSCMEEFFVVPIITTAGPDNGRITIKGDAIGFAVRDIYLSPINSVSQTVKAVRLNPDQIPFLVNTTGVYNGFYNGRGPTYFIENNDIVFYPALSENCNVLVRYFKAPNHLYPYLTCTTQVSSKDSLTNTLTLTNLPSGTIPTSTESPWLSNTGINATTFDAFNPEPPYNFKRSPTTGLPLTKCTIVSVNAITPSITVDTDTFNGIDAGDYLATTDTFGFVQYMPFEAYNCIALRASMRILKAQGDLQNLGISAQMYAAAANDLAKIITPKVENMQQKVSNFTSPIGQGTWSSGRWGR